MIRFHRSRILTIVSLLIMMLIVQLFGNLEHIDAKGNEFEQTIKVVLQQLYLDGEQSEEVRIEESHSTDEVLSEFKDWQLVKQGENEYVFQRHVDDISPLLKTNGYFGITGDGTLSTFNGKPETNDVIQSFFQIDIKKLESRMHHELMNGIRIHSRAQYLDVLKNYETYSKTEKQ